MRRGPAETPQYTGCRGLQTPNIPWSHDWPRPGTTVRRYCPTFFLLHSHCLGASRHAILGHGLTVFTVALTPSLTPSSVTYTIRGFLLYSLPYSRAGTTITFTIVIPPATTRPSVTIQHLPSAHRHLFAHITTRMPLAGTPSDHALNPT